MNKNHLLVIALVIGGIACSKQIVDSFSGFNQPANFPEALLSFQ